MASIPFRIKGGEMFPCLRHVICLTPSTQCVFSPSLHALLTHATQAQRATLLGTSHVCALHRALALRVPCAQEISPMHALLYPFTWVLHTNPFPDSQAFPPSCALYSFLSPRLLPCHESAQCLSQFLNPNCSRKETLSYA